MRNPDQTVYLRHARDAIQTIAEYLHGVDEATFLDPNHRMLRDAVLLQVQVIGEEARKLSPELRAKYPGTPWADIIGMRNRIVHDYVNVNLPILWSTASIDVPALAPQIQRMLADLGIV